VLRNGLPEPYRPSSSGYHLGTRLGELSKLQWSEVDLGRGEILLKRYTTKIKEPRVLPIYGEMGHFFGDGQERRDRLYPTCQGVFQNERESRFIFVTARGMTS
jgi:integrase